MVLISEYDKNRLAVKTLQQEYLTNEYLANEQDENFKYIKSKFFNWQSTDTAKILNVGSWLFEAISDTYSYYVWSPIWSLGIDLSEATKDFFANWYIALTITAEENVYSIERVPTNLHFYSHELEADVVLRLYAKEKNTSTNDFDKYLLHTAYYENRIENKLYKLWKADDYNLGVEVPLTEIEETKNLNPTEQTSVKPFWIIKKDDLIQYPISEAEKIRPIVYSIDRKTVMFETQFLRNTESFKLFKGMTRPKIKENDNVDYAVNWHDIYTTNSDAGIEFVDNINNLIKDAIEYESNQIRRVSSITKIPTDFLGLDNTHWAIWEGSRSILHWSFYKKIRDIQSLFDTQLKEMYEIVAKKNWVETAYVRPDVYIKNDKVLLEELILARDSRLITHTRAIMWYMDIDEKQAEEEKKKIMQEQEEQQEQESLVLDINQPINADQTQVWRDNTKQEATGAVEQ